MAKPEIKTVTFENKVGQNRVLDETNDRKQPSGSKRFKSQRIRVNFIKISGDNLDETSKVSLSKEGFEFRFIDQKVENGEILYWFWCRKITDDKDPKNITGLGDLTVFVQTSGGSDQKDEDDVEVDPDP